VVGTLVFAIGVVFPLLSISTLKNFFSKFNVALLA
jgi:hypothetical protein